MNAALAVVRRILNLAASEWIDEEQSLLFQELPDHLARMALFKVNTGCREQEVCRLRWDYEVKVPELDTCVFIVPSSLVKNGEERLFVLNRVAKSVVDSMRGLHPTHVFVRVPSKGEPRPIPKMYGTGWKSARERAADKWAERHGESASEGFRKIRVHDLKHTFGRRLRAAGVSFEDRRGLTRPQEWTHHNAYSQAELSNLLVAADKVCDAGESRKSPAVTWLRRRQSAVSA